MATMATAGRQLTPEEFAALLASRDPTYSNVSIPNIGPYGTGSNRGLPAPMGGLWPGLPVQRPGQPEPGSTTGACRGLVGRHADRAG